MGQSALCWVGIMCGMKVWGRPGGPLGRAPAQFWGTICLESCWHLPALAQPQSKGAGLAFTSDTSLQSALPLKGLSRTYWCQHPWHPEVSHFEEKSTIFLKQPGGETPVLHIKEDNCLLISIFVQSWWANSWWCKGRHLSRRSAVPWLSHFLKLPSKPQAWSSYQVLE